MMLTLFEDLLFCRMFPRAFRKQYAILNPAITRQISTVYTKFPPKMFWSNENANSDAEAAGPIARWIEAIICAIPFVAPRDRLLGGAEDMYINTAPY